MSDSEDDYMSDKLLQTCSQEDIRPGLVFNRSTKREYELDKRKKEMQLKRPKSHQEREIELRDKGLSTAISSDNKGFKMLEKMGFKPGQGLGKAEAGRTELVELRVKAGKSGVGVEGDIREKIKAKRKLKEGGLKEILHEFQCNTRQKLSQRFLVRDFIKAQRACEDLDFKKDIAWPLADYYWTRDTIKRKKEFADEEEEEEFINEFNSYTNEENLEEIIGYLRSRHLYCMFCAFVATDADDLKRSCPGPLRTDHDDD